jgi:hypothetical protein
MNITFQETNYEIPDDIDLLNPGDLSWVNSLFEALLDKYNNPLDIWKAVYEDLFTEPLLTEKHKYGICVLFSSIITERYLTEKFNADLANFADIVQRIQGESQNSTIMPNKQLILP